MDLVKYEGSKFCVVFAQQSSADGSIKLRCHHGRASVDHNGLAVVDDRGASIAVPKVAYVKILPNDGTEMLKDCKYFVIVTVGEGIEF